MSRPAKLERLRARAMNARTHGGRAYWTRSLKRNRAKYVQQTVAFDGVPTMQGLALLLAHARKTGAWHGRLNSSDRRKGVAERYGHQSQAALYDGYIHHRPGYLPANPPGRSSHELRSDGNAVYGRPAGAVLPWYQLGLDVNDDQALVAALTRMGAHVTHPYLTRSEAHHINLLRDPTQALVHLGVI